MKDSTTKNGASGVTGKIYYLPGNKEFHEFHRLLTIGSCPSCKSSNTCDCEHTAIQDNTVMYCNDCGKMSCLECGTAFQGKQIICGHWAVCDNCPASERETDDSCDVCASECPTVIEWKQSPSASATKEARIMTTSEAISRLASLFDKHGWPLYLNSRKLWDRASVSKDQDYRREDGWTVVKIKRHRGILGSSYMKGRAMSSFQTYYLCYAVHPDIDEFVNLPDEDGAIDINIWPLVEEMFTDDFSLDIEPVGNGKYMLFECTSKEKATVTLFDEALEFALNIVSNWADFFEEYKLNEYSSLLSDEQMKYYVSEFDECVKDKVTSLVEEAWQDREK